MEAKPDRANTGANAGAQGSGISFTPRREQPSSSACFSNPAISLANKSGWRSGGTLAQKPGLPVSVQGEPRHASFNVRIPGKEASHPTNETAHRSCFQRRLKLVTGNERRHGGDHCPVLNYRYIAPGETFDPGLFDCEKAIEIFDLIFETGVPRLPCRLPGSNSQRAFV